MRNKGKMYKRHKREGEIVYDVRRKVKGMREKGEERKICKRAKEKTNMTLEGMINEMRKKGKM